MIENIFAFDWDAPVSDQERDTILGRAASAIRKRGLQTPAIWFLEIHRPLAPLGAQLGIALSPFLGTLLGGGAFDLQKYTKLMQDRANVDRFIKLLDSDATP